MLTHAGTEQSFLFRRKETTWPLPSVLFLFCALFTFVEDISLVFPRSV